MKPYEVTLTHKEKLMVPAESPNDAVAIAIGKVKDRKFEPATWTVKEKAEEE
jgi:hypothetical protein